MIADDRFEDGLIRWKRTSIKRSLVDLCGNLQSLAICGGGRLIRGWIGCALKRSSQSIVLLNFYTRRCQSRVVKAEN
ncbi:unnamed protein product, partial [Mesorhabditis belari]|uniref:Uncharacterized protein n=1 Tax=Mesorhabditis belari TaxID=2138241 RepID=A0AAF3ED06_9BILA